MKELTLVLEDGLTDERIELVAIAISMIKGVLDVHMPPVEEKSQP